MLKYLLYCNQPERKSKSDNNFLKEFLKLIYYKLNQISLKFSKVRTIFIKENI